MNLLQRLGVHTILYNSPWGDTLIPKTQILISRPNFTVFSFTRRLIPYLELRLPIEQKFVTLNLHVLFLLVCVCAGVGVGGS